MLALFLLVWGSFLFSDFVQQETAKELFEKALYFEETKGDLENAIHVYKQIVEQFPNERNTAAEALLHLGICYEKMGKIEAQKAYERIITEFPDQRQTVEAARTRLASLNQEARGRRGPSEALSERKGQIFRKIEFIGQEETHLARLSPEAEKILFVDRAENGSGFSINVMDLSSGLKKTLVEGYEGGGMIPPEWSPDGKRIVFSYGQGEIRVVDVDDGEQHILWSSPDKSVLAGPWDWSLDGQSLLCAVVNWNEKTLHFGILPSAGGEPRFFLKGGLDSFIGGAAQFSPDGNYVVCQRVKDGNSDIYICDVEDGREIQLTAHPAKDDFPFWSPDGKFIVFMSDRAKTVDLWAIPMRGAEPVGDPLLVKRNLGKNTRLTDFTLGGVLTMMIYSQGLGKDLFVLPVDLESGEAQSQLRPFSKFPTLHSLMPQWSPDGKRIAYTSRKGNIGIPRIYVSSGSDKEELEITSQDLIVGNIQWSRDGESLIFPGFPNQDLEAQSGIFRVSLDDFSIETLQYGDRLTMPGLFGAYINLQWLPQANTFMFEKLLEKRKSGWYGKEIYKMDRDGKNVLQVSNRIDSDYFTWPSPNGKYLAYQEGQDLKLWSLEEDVFVKTLVRLQRGKTVEGPAWSPDGSRVAYKDSKQLKVLSVSENTTRVLVEAEGKSEIGGVPWAGGLAWSPDGKWIAYVFQNRTSDPKTQYELRIIPVEGGMSKKLASAPPSYPILGELSWHPTKNMIAITAEAEDSRMYEHWALENFLPKEK